MIVVEPTGSETQVFARVGGQEIVAVFRERHDFAPGQKIRLRPRPDMAHLFDPYERPTASDAARPLRCMTNHDTRRTRT